MELYLGFLASGRGSNVEAILKEIEKGNLKAEARVIISNKEEAGVLEVGRSRGLPSYYVEGEGEERDLKILELLRQYGVNLVVLAGYLKKVGRTIIDAYPNRILNIHPSLLPKFGGKGMYGMHVHEAVIGAGERESGVTIHIVDEEYDSGRIIAQYAVPVYEKDTPETLARRVLAVEHVAYPQTLIAIQEGLIDLDGEKAHNYTRVEKL